MAEKLGDSRKSLGRSRSAVSLVRTASSLLGTVPVDAKPKIDLEATNALYRKILFERPSAHRIPLWEKERMRRARSRAMRQSPEASPRPDVLDGAPPPPEKSEEERRIEEERRKLAEQVELDRRKDALLASVVAETTRKDVPRWLVTVFEMYPEAYDDVKVPVRGKKVEETESDKTPSEVESVRSDRVEGMPLRDVGGGSEANEERESDALTPQEVIAFLESMQRRPKQAAVFKKHLRTLAAGLHDEVNLDVAATEHERWRRMRHLQVIDDAKNEVRLKNTQRMAFKKTLAVQMPELIRRAVLAGMAVPEPEEEEEHAEMRTRLFGLLTKPSSGIDLKKEVKRIPAFRQHYTSSVCDIDKRKWGRDAARVHELDQIRLARNIEPGQFLH